MYVCMYVCMYRVDIPILIPIHIHWVSCLQQRRSRIQHKEVIKEDEMMYIPLLQSLQQMLNKEFILTQVKKRQMLSYMY